MKKLRNPENNLWVVIYALPDTTAVRCFLRPLQSSSSAAESQIEEDTFYRGNLARVARSNIVILSNLIRFSGCVYEISKKLKAIL
jgi:hypothetical protein